MDRKVLPKGTISEYELLTATISLGFSRETSAPLYDIKQGKKSQEKTRGKGWGKTLGRRRRILKTEKDKNPALAGKKERL